LSDRVLKPSFGLVLLICVAVGVVRTWHWPLVGDAPLMHYAVFLLEHGMAPYRGVADINMPGAWFVESAVMHLMGGGSLAWRIFDFLVSGGMTLAMVAIAWPYDRFAGFFAGALFMLLHLRDGLFELGQRDLVMALLLVIGYALLFHALRSVRPSGQLAATALFGFCVGFAATVKPTPVVLFPPLIALACLQLRRRGERWVPHLAAASAGFMLPLLLMLGYLWHEHAVEAFLGIIFRLIPAHADLHRRSFGYLVTHSFADILPPLLLLWLPVALFGRLRRNWEHLALLMGLLFGLASFYVQAKGYSYHRYPAEAFLLLMICLDLCVALREPHPSRAGWVRPLAVAGLALAVTVVGIGSTRKALRYTWRDQEFNHMLQADLTQLGGPSLNHHVQCLDIAVGCLDTLYRMQLVQDTGFLYDCYALEPAKSDGGYRKRFWEAMQADPPEVFVETSHTCGRRPRNYSYSDLNDWPRFADWIHAHYFIYASRIPPDPLYWAGEPGPPFGYRIYVRDDLRGKPAAGSTALHARARGSAGKMPAAKS
jgi:hypothetical protein